MTDESPGPAPARVLAAIVLAVGAEAVVILLGLGLAGVADTGCADPIYPSLARNLLDHARFAGADSPPYEPTVFRTPGYPLLIALVYALAGRHLVALQVAQFGLLAGTSWVLYRLARRLAGPRVAAASALLCATYPPFAFMACLHMTETLATFLVVATIDGMVRLLGDEDDPAAYRRALATGLAAGLASLVRPSSLLIVLVPGAAVLSSRGRARPMPRRAALALAVGAGCALPIAPWAARNYAVSGEFIPLAVGNGWSLYASAQQYRGEITYRMEWPAIFEEKRRRNVLAMRRIEAEGRSGPTRVAATARMDALVDRGYGADAREKFRGIGPGRMLGGVPRRLAYLWTAGDMSPWSSGPVHRLVQVHYAAGALLTALGLALRAGNVRRDWPLLAVPVYFTALHLVFHVEARYSFPARPFLMVYGAAGLVAVIDRVRALGALLGGGTGPDG